MNASDSSFRIRPPRHEEMSAVRRILPPAFRGRPEPELFVAVTGDPETVAGAASLRLVPHRQRPEQGRILLAVLEKHRRRGAGTALLDAVASRAREQRVPSLHAGRPFEDKSPGAQFLAASGFDAAPPTALFETTCEELERLLGPLTERLQARRPLRESIRVVALADAPVDQVRDLIMNHLPGASEMLALKISQGGSEGFSQKTSVVLMDGRRVLGTVLVKPDADRFRVSGLVVQPDHRNGGTCARLMLLAVQKIRNRGAEKVHFAANQTLHPQAWKLAHRLDAAPLWTRRGYYRDL